MNIGEAVKLAARDGFLLERQSTKDNVDVDSRIRVPKEQNARPPREVEGLLDTRDDSTTSCRRKQRGPPLFWRDGQAVDVTGRTRPTHDRSGDATHHHRRHSGVVEPASEVGKNP